MHGHMVTCVRPKVVWGLKGSWHEEIVAVPASEERAGPLHSLGSIAALCYAWTHGAGIGNSADWLIKDLSASPQPELKALCPVSASLGSSVPEGKF